MVERHGRRGEIIIEQQRLLIQRHTNSGISTVEAEYRRNDACRHAQSEDRNTNNSFP